MEQLALAVRVRERARFDNFFAGANTAALSLVRAVAAGRAGAFVLTGPAASGKTHLLLAATHAAQQAGRRAVYFALRELAPAGAAALSGQVAADLMCCDDIDLVAADAGFGHALFALWRDLEDRGASLLLAARDLPPLGAWALADLGSRVRGIAERVDLQLPDEAQLRQLLTQRARGLGLELPDETLEFMLRRLPRDLSSQCAVIEELDQAALAAQRRLTVPFVREVLARRPAR
jgi:DnaA family protein